MIKNQSFQKIKLSIRGQWDEEGRIDMSLRVRCDGRILCAAKSKPEPGDIYIDDGVHGWLAGSHETSQYFIKSQGENKSGEEEWKDITGSREERKVKYFEMVEEKGRCLLEVTLIKQIFKNIDTYYDKAKADKIVVLIADYVEAMQAFKDDIGIGRCI